MVYIEGITNNGETMRTSQKNVAKLYREVREHMGVRTNKEANVEISKLSQYFEDQLNPEFAAVMFSPYADNSWKVAGMNKDCQWCSMYLEVSEFMENPETIVETFLGRNW